MSSAVPAGRLPVTDEPAPEAEVPAPKRRSRFWKMFRAVYPFVVLLLLYVIWKDVLPAYRFLTRPVSPVLDDPAAPVPDRTPPIPEGSITPQSLLESSPSALPAIREAVERTAPNSARAQVGLGLLYESKGRPEEALLHYRRAVELDPLLPDAHFRLGYALLSRRELTAAKRSFEAAIGAKPDYLPARYGLGAVLQADGRPEAARKVYEDILAINAKEYQALNNLGIAFEESGDGARALGCFEAALRLKPDDPVVAENASGARNLYGSAPAKACVDEKALAAAVPAPVAAAAPKKAVKKPSGDEREVRLKNGQTLYGRITEETKDGVWFESGDGAKVFISRNEIAG